MEETAAEKAKVAIENGNLKDIEAALKYKYIRGKDRVGRDGFTLLHWACFYGNLEILQKLIVQGGSVSVVDKHGWTPAHICAIKGNDNCLKGLLNYKADLATKDYRGYTCGHLAAAHGNTYTLQTIVKSGWDIDTTDRRGWTAVHHASFHGRYGALQFLAKLDINLMSVDHEGNIPAHFAAAEGHMDCLRLLVYYNHQPLPVLKSRNNKGATPKELAVQFQKQDCADFLASAELEASLDDEHISESPYPAHKAAHNGNMELLSMLILEGHCSINQQDTAGSTAAHKAAGSGHAHCLQWLIDHGADVSITNNLNETPLEVAQKYAKTNCVVMLGGGDRLDTEEEMYKSPETLQIAQQEVEKLSTALTVAKNHLKELGGVVKEDAEREQKENEIINHHKSVVANLESELDMEREKREVLESEIDSLRSQLYNAKTEVLSYKAQLTAAQVKFDTSIHTQKAKPVTSSKSTKTKSRSIGGGAYFCLEKK